MSAQINAFVFLTIIATMAFTYLKLAFGSIIAQKDFRIWVISWFSITFFAFFSNNFLLFVLLSTIFIFAISRKVENKLALFLILLYAIPSFQEKLSVLFTINFTRELSLLLLFPLLTKLLSPRRNPGLKKFGKLATDKLVLLYLGILFVLYFRGLHAKVEPTTLTEGIRYGFYLFCELFLPYYVASRYIKDFDQFKTVVIAFISICTVAGCIGMFEIAKSWLLYGNLSDFLGAELASKTYLLRGGFIRASSSLDHSLILGLVMLMALGFYLSTQHLIKSNLLKIGGFLLLLGGLISPLARGAWMGAFFMLIFYFSLGYKKYRNIAIILLAGFLSIPLLAIIPGGQKILNFLPFIGTLDKFNVDYRDQLIDHSLLVIKKYPFFGTFEPIYEPEMQDMVQGEGIIDLVNYYIHITLYLGLVGLFSLISLFASFTIPLLKHINRFKDQTSLQYLFGKSLFTLLIGTFITIATLSALNMVNTTLFVLAGLTISYIRVTKDRDESVDSESPDGRNTQEKEQYPTSRIIQKDEHQSAPTRRLLK